MVFREPVSIDALNALGRGNMLEHLGIVFTAAGDDWLSATMPVDARTRQPYGLLHGGASVVLAETLGSSAGNLCVDPSSHMCVGVEINANHIRAVTSGLVRVKVALGLSRVLTGAASVAAPSRGGSLGGGPPRRSGFAPLSRGRRFSSGGFPGPPPPPPRWRRV